MNQFGGSGVTLKSAWLDSQRLNGSGLIDSTLYSRESNLKYLCIIAEYLFSAVLCSTMCRNIDGWLSVLHWLIPNIFMMFQNGETVKRSWFKQWQWRRNSTGQYKSYNCINQNRISPDAKHTNCIPNYMDIQLYHKKKYKFVLLVEYFNDLPVDATCILIDIAQFKCCSLTMK